MRELIQTIVVLLCLSVSTARAQEAEILTALERAGVANTAAGFQSVLSGVGQHALILARDTARNPGIAHVIQSAGVNVRVIISDLVRTSPALTASIVARIARLSAAGLSGSQVTAALPLGNTWIGLRTASASVSGVFLLAVTPIVAHGKFLQGRKVGRALRSIMLSHANSAEKEAYAHLLFLLVQQIKRGSVKLCKPMKLVDAARMLSINMHQRGNRPYAGIACKNNEGSNFAAVVTNQDAAGNTSSSRQAVSISATNSTGVGRWFNTGRAFQKGTNFSISASGKWRLGDGPRESDANGLPNFPKYQGFLFGTLLGKIGVNGKVFSRRNPIQRPCRYVWKPFSRETMIKIPETIPAASKY